MTKIEKQKRKIKKLKKLVKEQDAKLVKLQANYDRLLKFVPANPYE